MIWWLAWRASWYPAWLIALTAALECASADGNADFTCSGSDGGEEVCGDGWAEPTSIGDLQGEFRYDNGHKTPFKAVPADCFNGLLGSGAARRAGC